MYYLASNESYNFGLPRGIDIIRSAKPGDKTFLWVRMRTPLIGQNFGYGEQDITDIVLRARHQGYDLSNLSNFPIDVYVLLPPVGFDWDKFDTNEMENIAWASVFNNFEDAKKISIEHK